MLEIPRNGVIVCSYPKPLMIFQLCRIQKGSQDQLVAETSFIVHVILPEPKILRSSVRVLDLGQGSRCYLCVTRGLPFVAYYVKHCSFGIEILRTKVKVGNLEFIL